MTSVVVHAVCQNERQFKQNSSCCKLISPTQIQQELNPGYQLGIQIAIENGRATKYQVNTTKALDERQHFLNILEGLQTQGLCQIEIVENMRKPVYGNPSIQQQANLWFEAGEIPRVCSSKKAGKLRLLNDTFEIMGEKAEQGMDFWRYQNMGPLLNEPG
ncbi:hypothetical protein HanPSC8_Chr07g0306481 [Helianthus annuus]|nr:hypothetical protein HanPSC8_Chr07g0306481 [Helianthus annuus]